MLINTNKIQYPIFVFIYQNINYFFYKYIYYITKLIPFKL